MFTAAAKIGTEIVFKLLDAFKVSVNRSELLSFLLFLKKKKQNLCEKVNRSIGVFSKQSSATTGTSNPIIN